MALNPYLELWRSNGLDAARELAIDNGENVVYHNPHTNKLDVANPTTQVASVYDAQSGAAGISPVFLLAGGLILVGLLK